MTIAEELSTLVSALIGAPLPVRLRAWDDSETGPDGDAPVLHIRDKNALRRLLWRPGELGLAQAYISGEIDVIGDLAEGLGRVWRLAGSAAPPRGPRARLAALPFCLRHGILGPRPSDPDLAAKVSGRLHSRERDQAAIAFHYDLSNDFYQRLLDPRMVYSCGYWTEEKPEYGLADAQRDKLDLVCRKLGLRPGSRLLDIGCGWGALAIHAALHYGATVVGVTLSKRQHDFAVERARQVGADDAVTLRLGHWRDVTESGFDAVSAIEIGEHIGASEYPVFARHLYDRLNPTGRLLVQQMSRGATAPGGGAFIETYIVPDMHMRPLGETVGLLEDAGLEVREVQALREHYVRTVRAWHDTLEAQWDAFANRFGEPLARVWRLYLIGGALAFQQGRMGVDQILATATTPEGVSGTGEYESNKE